MDRTVVSAHSDDVDHPFRAKWVTRYMTEISSVLKVPGEGILYRVSWRELLRVGHEERTSAYEGALSGSG